MAQFLWSMLYLIVGFWILSRVLAYLVQWLLKRYMDITLRFGSVGFLNFGKVQLTLKRNVSVHVELEKIWLSSSFVNPDMRKPLVICIDDMRIQVDVHNPGPGPHGPADRRRDQHPGRQGTPLAKIVQKAMMFSSYGGLRINNFTVMLLRTMVPDYLIHFSSPALTLDITAAYDKYELCMNLTNFGCKALRTVNHEDAAAHQNCLAETSFTVKMEAKVDKINPTKLMVLKTVIARPQMMITECFMQSLQTIDTRKFSLGGTEDDFLPGYRLAAAPGPTAVAGGSVSDSEGEDEAGERYVHWPNESIFSKLLVLEKLQDVSLDISDLDVKIVRETKQRSLAVSLKLFHLGFHNQSFWQATDVNCNVYLEEFNTSSMQAKFAGLSKIVIKGQLLRDSIDTFLTMSSGFFHYHHEEVQYWVSVFTNMIRRPKPMPVRPKRSRLRRTKSVPNPTLLSWFEGKNLSTVLELADLSSTVSTAACTGLHCQLAHARINGSIKPSGGVVLEQSEWFHAYNASCEVDVQNVTCGLVEARLQLEQTSSRRHYWGQVMHLGMLIMKVKKFGWELKVEGMMDNIQLEWSSGLHNALSQLIMAVRRNQRPLQTAASAADPVTGATNSVLRTNAHRAEGVHEARRACVYVVKFDLSNINTFVTNGIGVSVMMRVDAVTLSHSSTQSQLAVDGTKVQYIICDKPFHVLHRSSEIQHPVAHLHQIKVKYTPANKEYRVHILQHMTVSWRKEAHLCVVEGAQDAASLVAKLRGQDGDATAGATAAKVSKPTSPGRGQRKSSVCVNILVLAEISLEAKLTDKNKVSLFTHNVLMTMTLPDMLMEVKDMTIQCDGHKIFRITVRFTFLLTHWLPELLGPVNQGMPAF